MAHKEISKRILSLLSLNGSSQKDLALYMGIKTQSLQNKLQRGSFTADDLIKIADFVGADLVFKTPSMEIRLDNSCSRNNDPAKE